MTFIVSGIPMALIPHPQGPWLEGINPVTNLQWRQGVEPLLNEGARYCLLEADYRGRFVVKHLGNLNDVMDIFGRDNVPKNWHGQNVMARSAFGRGLVAAFFQWFPDITSVRMTGFDRDEQPAINVSWFHAKGWTLVQGGLHLLTDAQWLWSAQGGERGLEYATETGNLFSPDGRKLAHCSAGARELATIDVDDPRYPDGPFGLRHKTGNVWEWVKRDLREKFEYGLRGGSFFDDLPEALRVAFRFQSYPVAGSTLFHFFGFRVGAPVPDASSIERGGT